MENLKVTFLGGIDEIGKNMTVLEYKDDMIVIDSGLSFPDEAMPGVDLVVQDLTYLIKNKSKVRGIFITHGHEDHIGSICYLLDSIKAPIYATRVTLGLIENKLREAKKSNVIMKSCNPGTVVVAGDFKVEFVSVTHSIPGSVAFVISTPVATVVHTGDFKIDFTPIGNDHCDLKRLSELGKKGVDLLLCESTNVERLGFSMSESVVGKTLDELFAKLADKRIIIATFASNIHRLQQIINNAEKYKRKIAFTGRSMVNVSDMAIKLGELHCDRDIIIDIDKIDKYTDRELIIISTGSQGESMSALTRMASDNFPKIKLCENDAVILSSAPIPGNEKAINVVINNLYRKGCKVIYNELADVHASGHAYKEELKIMHSIVRPKYFVPIHGEYRHLKNHQDLALELGMKNRDIIIPELGMQVEVGPNTFKVAGSVQAGAVLIDGTGVGDKDSNVIRDRLTLSQDGVCAVVLTLSGLSKRVLGPVDIISRGFIYQDEASDIIAEAREVISKNLEENYDLKSLDTNEIKNAVKKVATSYFFKKTKRKPMILSIVVFKDMDDSMGDIDFKKTKKNATAKTLDDELDSLFFVDSLKKNIKLDGKTQNNTLKNAKTSDTSAKSNKKKTKKSNKLVKTHIVATVLSDDDAQKQSDTSKKTAKKNMQSKNKNNQKKKKALESNGRIVDQDKTKKGDLQNLKNKTETVKKAIKTNVYVPHNKNHKKVLKTNISYKTIKSRNQTQKTGS